MAILGVKSFLFQKLSKLIITKQPAKHLSCEVEIQRLPCTAPVPCYEKDILVERAHIDRSAELRPFLYQNAFASNLSIAGLLMPHNSKYLGYLANKYSTTGDRWLAYQIDHGTRKRKLIGALAAYLKFPWESKKLYDWASECPAPDCYLMHFTSHCFKHPDLFKKYDVPCVYDIELLTTTMDTKYWVRDLLLHCAIQNAKWMDFPLVRLLATDPYLFATCARTGMVHEWSMKYSDFCDERGWKIFWLNDLVTVNLFTFSTCRPKSSQRKHTRPTIKQLDRPPKKE